MHDVVICVVEGLKRACRIMDLLWGEAEDALLTAVRLFHTANEVVGDGEDERREGFLRIWEEVGLASTLILPSTAVIDLCEIYFVQQLAVGQGQRSWAERAISDTEAYVGEGFAALSRDGSLTLYKETEVPWAPEGPLDQPLASARQEGFHLNQKNLPFASLPLVMYNDAFNAWGMDNKVRYTLRRVRGRDVIIPSPWRLPGKNEDRCTGHAFE